MEKICEKCGKPCEVIEEHWEEKDEFWGAPCWRPCCEEKSDCCGAEIVEVDDAE